MGGSGSKGGRVCGGRKQGFCSGKEADRTRIHPGKSDPARTFQKVPSQLEIFVRVVYFHYSAVHT